MENLKNEIHHGVRGQRNKLNYSFFHNAKIWDVMFVKSANFESCNKHLQLRKFAYPEGCYMFKNDNLVLLKILYVIMQINTRYLISL